MNDSKRGKVTEEHREEARLLKKIWDATYKTRQTNNLHTQGAFGAEYGIGGQAVVGFFINGQTALSLKAAKGFAKGLNCLIADFSPRLAALESSWPFELVDRERYESLAPALRFKAQVRFDDYIKELLAEAAITNSPAKVSPEYQDELNQMTQAAEARRDNELKQRPFIPRDGTTGH